MLFQNTLHSSSPVSFQFNPVLELITAMYRTANFNLFNEVYTEYRVPLDEDVVCWIREMEQRLSPFMRRELNHFFKLDHSHADQAFHQLAFSENHGCTIQSLFDKVAKIHEGTIVKYMAEDISDENTRESFLNLLNDEGFQNTRLNTVGTMTSEDITSNYAKDRVNECLADLLETKSRFKALIHAFYVRSYAHFEERIISKYDKAIPGFEKLFADNQESFFIDYLGMPCHMFQKDVLIHVSVLTQYGSFVSLNTSLPVPHYVRLGINIETAVKRNSESEVLEKFCKVISDKNRLEIIRLLTNRPWYGQELAKHLTISPAAVSYHMGFLHAVDLITLKRADQKGYYVLDKAHLKNLFSLFEQTLDL